MATQSQKKSGMDSQTQNIHTRIRAHPFFLSHMRARNTQIREIHTREKKSDYHIDENDVHTWEERRVRSGMKKKRERKPGETIRACGSMTSAKTKDEGIA